MARPLSFDRTASLEAAMILFWQRGYQACALPDLLNAMNISRSSLYATFGDKRQLFIECLDLFFQRTFNPLCQTPSQPRETKNQGDKNSDYSLISIEHFFRYTILQVPKKRRACGCLLVNTVLEMAEQDRELSALASEKLTKVEQYFIRCFAKAKAGKTLNTDASAEDLGQLCMTLNQGLRVASRQGRSQQELESILNNSLKMLGIHSQKENT
ncbi:TetR/AcrR family transcriptional regulator [Pseudoteredinibacter isoporae]|uniref:TetR/AcrR family transcriptional regulator n=1 Tax=Pseudoteredinibacter isoporae TaxID=570281 RepID=UPI0031061479